MPAPASRITFPRALLAAAFFLAASLSVPSLLAQFAKPLLHVDDDIPVFSLAPDNRLAYSVRHIKHVEKTDIERDDLWVVSMNGKRDRLIDSQKIVKGSKPENFVIRAIYWAPDSRHLIVSALTAAMADVDVSSLATERAIPFDSSQREVPLDSALASSFEAGEAMWMPDYSSIVFLDAGSARPGAIHASISRFQPSAKKSTPLFNGELFEGVAWDVSHSAAIAVQRNLQAAEGLQLVWLDLASGAKRVIGPIDGFERQLVLSPSRTRVAYFSGPETIEIRDLAAPAKPVSMHVPPGSFAWAPGEQYLLLKRSGPTYSTELFWIHIPDGGMTPMLHGLVFGGFQISMDGSCLALQNAGLTGLQIIPMPVPGS